MYKQISMAEAKEIMSAEKDYILLGFEKTMKKYNLMGWKIELQKMVRGMIALIPKPIKKSVKKIRAEYIRTYCF